MNEGHTFLTKESQIAETVPLILAVSSRAYTRREKERSATDTFANSTTILSESSTPSANQNNKFTSEQEVDLSLTTCMNKIGSNPRKCRKRHVTFTKSKNINLNIKYKLCTNDDVTLKQTSFPLKNGAKTQNLGHNVSLSVNKAVARLQHFFLDIHLLTAFPSSVVRAWIPENYPV